MDIPIFTSYDTFQNTLDSFFSNTTCLKALGLSVEENETHSRWDLYRLTVLFMGFFLIGGRFYIFLFSYSFSHVEKLIMLKTLTPLRNQNLIFLIDHQV